MARKRRKTPKKFFPRNTYYGSIPSIQGELKKLLGALENTRMASKEWDDRTLTTEGVVNTLILWAASVADGPRGAAELEKVLWPHFVRTFELAAEYKKKHPELWEHVEPTEAVEGRAK